MKTIAAAALFAVLLQFAACSTEKMSGGGGLPASLAEVPSVRLNYRYEADVPSPEATEKPPAEERHPGVLADFDRTVRRNCSTAHSPRLTSNECSRYTTVRGTPRRSSAWTCTVRKDRCSER